MGSGDDTRPQFGSSLPLWQLCATSDVGSAPRGLCPPGQVALTPVLGPLHCGRGQPCSQCPQQPGLGLNWCMLGLPEKPCPIAVGSACAHSGVTQQARWRAALPNQQLARASVSPKRSSVGEAQPTPG